MQRFYKVRIICGEAEKQEYETFIIYPSKSNFDCFMTEICSRLPELFYQPFKLYYEDASGEFITIFNWLDFGVFYMQCVDKVYILKGDTKTHLHYRTLWSMPMPTAPQLASYEQFMSQSSFNLSQPTYFNFIRNANNCVPASHLPTAPSQPGEPFHNLRVPTQNPVVSNLNPAAPILNPAVPILNPAAPFLNFGAQIPNLGAPIHKFGASILNSGAPIQNLGAPIHNLAAPIQNLGFLSQHLNAQTIADNGQTVSAVQHGELFDFAEAAQKKTDQNFSFDGLYNNSVVNSVQNTNAHINAAPTVNESITKLDCNEKIPETSGIQKLSDIPNENNVHTLITAIETHRKIVESNIQKLLDEPDEPFNETNPIKSLHAAPTKMSKKKGKISYARPIEIVEPAYLIEGRTHSFLVGDIVEVCSGDWQFLQGKVIDIAGDMITIEGGFTNENNAVPLNFKASELSKCPRPKNNSIQNKEGGSNIVQQVSLNDNSCESSVEKMKEAEQVAIKTTEVETGKSKDENVLENESIQIPNIANSETTNGISSDKTVSNVPNKDHDDAIVDINNKIQDDTAKLNNIVETGCSLKEYAENNDGKATESESREESPTSREWSLVETYSRFTKSPVPAETGTIPKNTQDLNHNIVKRRTLPQIPNANGEEAMAIPNGQATEGYINETVSIMIGMGFSNEGDQLLRLVESVDGNISSALDLLDSQK